MNTDLFRDYLVVDVEAAARHRRHEGHPTHRPLADGYERVGLIGEREFARQFGLDVDTSARPDGDGGRDFSLALQTRAGVEVFTVDVKSARKPGNLIVERGKVRPRVIYPLAGVTGDTAVLLGWEWGAVLLAAPTRDFGYGVINHYIPRRCLRPIQELHDRRASV